MHIENQDLRRQNKEHTHNYHGAPHTVEKRLGSYAYAGSGHNGFRYIELIDKEKVDDRRERIIHDLVGKYADHPIAREMLEKFYVKTKDHFRYPSDFEYAILFENMNHGIQLYEKLCKHSSDPSPEEIINLARAAASRQVLMITNQPLIIFAARIMPGHYKDSIDKGYLDMEDIYQMGNPGLARAIVKFDPTKGSKFSTYAVTWIQQSIHRLHGLTAKTIRIPAHIANAVKAIETFSRQFEIQNGRMPTDDELCDGVNISDHILAKIQAIHTVSSLDEPAKGGGTMKYGDIITSGEIPVADYVERVIYEDEVKETISIAELTDVEKMVISNRYGISFDGNIPESGPSLIELAAVLNCELIDVRRIERSALNKLRVHADRLSP